MSSGLGHIAEQVEAIERSVADSPGLTFDLSRTLVESACRTVLTERSIEWGRRDDVPKLVKKATRTIEVHLMPDDAELEDSAKATQSLRQTLQGLSSAVQGICELRNQFGLASHGADRARGQLDVPQAVMAAQTADMIVSFVYGMHVASLPTPEPDPQEEERKALFNAHLDEVTPELRILDAVFVPSEVLATMEPATYRAYLTEFDPVDEGSDAETGAA